MMCAMPSWAVIGLFRHLPHPRLIYLLLAAAVREAHSHFRQQVRVVVVLVGIEPLPACPYLLGPLTRLQLAAAVLLQAIPEAAVAIL